MILFFSKNINMDYFKLRDWIDIDKLNWNILSYNLNAIKLLEENPDKINWSYL